MSTHTIFRLILAAILALIPAMVWGWIFYKKQVGMKKMTMVTFAAGALFVTPLLFYKYLWQFFPWLDAFKYTEKFSDDVIGFANFGLIPLDVLLTFMIVGIIEEAAKLWAVKATDRGKICSVDDAIEMSIMAALGFAFAENILYFYNIISSRGVENLMYPFVFRSLFSTFAHVMFSGVMGYFYGMAVLSKNIMAEPSNKRKWPFITTFARMIHFKKEILFHDEKVAEGLLIAIILHAVFNIFLEMNWVFLLVPYLTAGYIYLTHLLTKKEANKIYCAVNTALPEGK